MGLIIKRSSEDYVIFWSRNNRIYMKQIYFSLFIVTAFGSAIGHSKGLLENLLPKAIARCNLFGNLNKSGLIPTDDDVIELVVPETKLTTVHAPHWLAHHGKIHLTTQHAAKAVAIVAAFVMNFKKTEKDIIDAIKFQRQPPSNPSMTALKRVSKELIYDRIKDLLVARVVDKISDMVTDALPEDVKKLRATRIAIWVSNRMGEAGAGRVCDAVYGALKKKCFGNVR